MATPQNETSSIFDPQVFNEMVNAFEPNREHVLYNSVRKTTTTYPYAQWTKKYGRASTLAEYNVPNAKANVIEKEGGEEQGSSALMYIREGQYFTPSVTLFSRDIEAGDTNAIVPAERLVADEVKAVNDRIDNRIEWSLWQAVQGGFTYKGNATGTVNVDYGFRDTHKATLEAAQMWDAGTATIDTLISNLRNMKTLIQKDGGVPVTDVYLSQATFDLLIDAWTKSATDSSNRSLLSDRMLDQYMSEGKIDGFMGVGSWKTQNSYYDVRNADGSVDIFPYVPHGTIIFGNLSANGPLRYEQGPSVDFDAPQGHIGRFAKNWLSKDPSGRQFLIEEHGLPVLDRPDQFATLKVASDEWAAQQGL